MMWFVESYEAIRDFFEAGGDVLWAILIVTIMLWTLILERTWYFRMVQPDKTRAALETWQSMEDHDSWHARQIRQRLISEIGLSGLREGGASLNTDHPNFLIARQGATSNDCLKLIERVREQVLLQTGIDLQSNLQIW
jgi:biopolymer transport protein ExbB/TolQ